MISQIDFFVLDFIREHISCGFLDAVMKFITSLGDVGGVWVLTAIVLLMFKKTRKAGLCMALALIITSFVGNIILKNIFQRPRPFLINATPLIITAPGGFSFPSGHTCVSFAGAGAFGMYFKRKAWIFYTLAALIGFSRIYLYVHYPSDVIAGALLGIIIAYLCFKVVKK